jgi:homocysteine S-methyltransferase
MPASTKPLAAALAEGPVVLDGGLSNQLADQGCDLSDELWSARLLADAPEQIQAAHAAYVRAGARVLITSSYSGAASSWPGWRPVTARTCGSRRPSARTARCSRTAASTGAATG